MKVKTWVLPVFALLLAAGGWRLYQQFRTQRELPEGLVQASGRLEGDHVLVACKYGGKILRLQVTEGEIVQAQQTLVWFDDRQAKDKLKQAQARLEQSQARWDRSQGELDRAQGAVLQASGEVSQTEAAIAVLNSQQRSAEISLVALRKEVSLQEQASAAQLVQAENNLTKAQASYGQAQRDDRRFQALLESQTVERRRAEQARVTLDLARGDLENARQAVVQARSQREISRLGKSKVAAREQDLQALRDQEQQARANLLRAHGSQEQAQGALRAASSGGVEARAGSGEARALIKEAEHALEDLTVKSPITGSVAGRLAEPGEVLAPGTPVADLVNLDKLYLKVFVPEKEIGRVRLGLKAQIYSDAFPDLPNLGTVRFISPQASFTPKEVQTKDERVKLVYAVKIYLDENPEHRLTPGLPADAVIRWKEQVAWQKPLL